MNTDIMVHTCTCISYESHLEKKVYLSQKGKNAVKSQKVIFKESQKLLTEQDPQKAAYSDQNIQ